MLNKAILMGRLTRDPELRTTPNGVTVANFSLAIDRRFQRQGEEKQTDFFNVVAFSKQAEFVSKYFIKGQLCAVVGSIQNRTWVGQDGKKNYATDIIAEEINFVGGKKENPTREEGQGSGNFGYSNAEPANSMPSNDSGFMPIDDDESLPF